MTARYLCKQTFPIGPGHRALVYAAAGGTGQILLQWIKHLGGKHSLWLFCCCFFHALIAGVAIAVVRLEIIKSCL